MKRTVFISHSSRDKNIANDVCNFLEKHGVLCWMAPRDITPGKNYGAAIIDAIIECEFFVLILSSRSNDSLQIVREVERAASTQSVIIPLRVEAVQPSKDLELYVSAAHRLDAVTPPLDQHLMELLRAIEGWQKNEGQRRRRILQPAEDIAPVAPRDTPLPDGARVGKWPRIWIAVLSAVAVAAISTFVLLLKQCPSTTPTDVLRQQTPPPSPSVEASREFIIGRWQVEQTIGQVEGRTYVDYESDGSFSGKWQAFLNGQGVRQELRGSWDFTKLAKDRFRLHLTSDNGTEWNQPFRIVDHDRIHNIEQNYDAVRVAR